MVPTPYLYGRQSFPNGDGIFSTHQVKTREGGVETVRGARPVATEKLFTKPDEVKKK